MFTCQCLQYQKYETKFEFFHFFYQESNNGTQCLEDKVPGSSAMKNIHFSFCHYENKPYTHHYCPTHHLHLYSVQSL